MTKVNQELLERIKIKLGLSRRQVYRLIEEKMRETHLNRNLAAILVASDKRINTAKYTTSDDRAMIRSALTHQPISQSKSSPVSVVTRTIVRPSTTITIDPSFIRNVELREIIKRDIAELNVAYSQGLSRTAKTCMVLSGSIAEALLLEKLTQNLSKSISVASSLPSDLRPKSPNNPEEWDLYEMISIAINMTPPLLPEDASTGAHQLRKWRNLIHPGCEMRESRNREFSQEERANNAIAFLQFIARELGC